MQVSPSYNSQLRDASHVSETLTGKVVLVVGASVLVGVCAHVSLPLPFTPVPLTLGDLAVLVVGVVLGPTVGFWALCLYLLEGAGGLPVFTPGGLGGTAQLFGPTGGFLFSYPLVALLAGYVSRQLLRVTAAFGAGFCGATCASFLLFFSGATWLAMLLHLRAATAIHLAVQPFLAGNAIKLVLTASTFQLIHRIRQHA